MYVHILKLIIHKPLWLQVTYIHPMYYIVSGPQPTSQVMQALGDALCNCLSNALTLASDLS